MKNYLLMAIFVAAFSFAQAQNAANPGDWISLYNAAKERIELSDYYTATQYLEKAASIHQSDTLKRSLAVCSYHRGYYDKCTRLCLEVLAPDTLERDLALLCKSLALSSKDIDSVLYFEKMLFDKNPLNQFNTLALTNELIQLQDYKDAFDCVQKYYELDSANLSINTSRARLFYLRGNSKKAMEEFEKIIAAGITTPSNFYYVGVCARQLHDYQKAVENLEIANAMLNESSETVLIQLGFAKLQVDSLAYDGVENLNKAVDVMQPDPETLTSVYYHLGGYYEKINWRKALNYYLKVKELGGTDASLLYRISICYQKLENQPKEMEYLSKFLDISDDSIACAYARQRIKYIKSERFMSGKN